MASTPKNFSSPLFKNDVLTSLRKKKAESHAGVNASMQKVRMAFRSELSQEEENSEEAARKEGGSVIQDTALSLTARKHFFASLMENEDSQQHAYEFMQDKPTGNSGSDKASTSQEHDGLNDEAKEYDNIDEEGPFEESVSQENVDVEEPDVGFDVDPSPEEVLDKSENELSNNEETYPQLPPHMADLPWKDVKTYLEWSHVKVTKALKNSWQYYLPAPYGKPEKEGGVEGIDFFYDELDMRRFTVKHCGWKGDAVFWRQHKLKLKEVTGARRARKSRKTNEKEENTAVTNTAIAIDIDGEDANPSEAIINLITPGSGTQQPADAGNKRSVSQKRSTKPTSNSDSTNRPKSKSTKSSNKYAVDILSRAGVGNEYVGHLTNVISSSSSVCRSHLTEDDLAFLPLAERRAVWVAINESQSSAAQEQNDNDVSVDSTETVRQFLVKTLPGIPSIDLDQYMTYFCRERYHVFGMENLEQGDLPASMPKAYKKRILAATTSATSNKKTRKH